MSSERDGLDPALRVNVGELILNGNTFSDSETTLMFFLDEATPNSQKHQFCRTIHLKTLGKRVLGKNRYPL